MLSDLKDLNCFTTYMQIAIFLTVFRALHKQYGDLISIRFFHHHLIFVGGSKTTNELLVKRGDVLGRKPYFFIGTEIFQNAGNKKACFFDTLEKKEPIDIFIFLNFYPYNLENTIFS